jgi:biopolymer transport protein TolR
MANERLSTAQIGKIRRMSQPRELSPDEEGGELNIVPYLDIVVNILMFVLSTLAVTFTATIETLPPAAGGKGVRSDKDTKALNLTVLITSDGLGIKAAGGNVAPGCEGIGSGIAIPLKGATYDYDSLTDCAQKLKSSSPDFEDEMQVYIGANPDIAYQTVISVIDALRSDKQGKPLFTDPNFKVAK